MALTVKEKKQQTIFEKPNVEKVLHQAVTFLNKIRSPLVENSLQKWRKQISYDGEAMAGQKMEISVPKDIAVFLGEKNDFFVKGIRGSLVHRFEKGIQLLVDGRSVTLVFEKKKNQKFFTHAKWFALSNVRRGDQRL